MQAGQIPILHVEADTIPRAYEQAIREVWEKGISVRTEYDRPEDPPSRDATVVIVVREPFAQPRFHRSFADGLGGLAEYVMEVVHGAHDYWVKPLEEMQVKKGSIIIPDTAKERPMQGEVIEIGPGRVEDGKKIAMEVKKGNKILYGKYSGTEVTIDDIEYLIMRESDILAILG